MTSLICTQRTPGMPKRRLPSAKQSGIALLVILLIVATVAALATQMHWQHRISVRRIDNLNTLQQARQFATGGESWAREILLDDLRESTSDHLDETWATALPALPIDGGAIQGRLQDLQSRFNINNLITNQGSINPDAVEQLRRLLLNLELEPDLAAAISDWIDADNYPEFPGGAEDETYASLANPYRTPNHFISDISELRAIKGIDKRTFAILKAYICALPIDTAININTASPEVLLSISQNLNISDVESMIQQRVLSPFESISDFYSMNQLDQSKEPALIDTQSEFFLAEIEVLLQERLYRRHTYLFRDAQTGSVSPYQRVHTPDQLPQDDSGSDDSR